MRELSLKEIQEYSLELLKGTTDICENKGFRYFLVYGTLLGAIRHNGFIPWDDDIDIMMPRNDYEMLIQHFESNNYVINGMRMLNYRTNKEYPYYIVRITDDRFKLIVDNEKEFKQGIFIDVYPYDGLGNERKIANRICIKGEILSSFCFQASRKKYAFEYTKGIIRKFLKFPMFVLSKIIGKFYFQNKLDKIKNLYNYDDSKYVGCAVWNSCGAGIVQERKWFSEYIMHIFGKYSFRIPKDYDNILSHIYGDYMKLPPENERYGHHYYKVYKIGD